MEKLYIICVDDQRDVLGSIVRDLAPFADWTVVEECESAEEAAGLMDELAATDKPVALIVCDHIMPGMNGIDFLAAIDGDRRFPHLKKILFTGQATQQDTIEAINKAHIDYYIEKPWDAAELEKACRSLLSHYLFDTGRFTMEYKDYLAPDVLLARLSGRE